MTESHIQDSIRLALGNVPGLVLFRNNIGSAVMRGGFRVAFGVGGPGGSDLVGIYRGRAVFVEVKTPIGKLSPAQKQFRDLVEGKGATYVVLRSVDDARAWILQMEKTL